jgi:hypothetical protein
MQHEGSFSCSYETATERYPESDKFSPDRHTIFLIRFIVILFSHISSVISNGVSLLGYLTKTRHAFIICSTLAVCPAIIVGLLHDVITKTICSCIYLYKKRVFVAWLAASLLLCCSCKWGETMSLNCGHQRAYWLSRRWYKSLKSHGGMILTGEERNSEIDLLHHRSHLD